MQAESILRVGADALDPVSRQLCRGKRQVTLTDKAFQVLCYLAEHPGQLVTKGDLHLVYRRL